MEELPVPHDPRLDADGDEPHLAGRDSVVAGQGPEGSGRWVERYGSAFSVSFHFMLTSGEPNWPPGFL